MKISNVMFTTRKGGLEQAFLDYNDALNCKGHEVFSIIHKDCAIKSEISTKTIQVANFSKYDPIALIRLYFVVLKEKPDVIITHGNRAYFMMKLVSGKIPVIGVCHGYSFDQIVKCDHIFSVSNDMKNKIIEKGFNKNKIHHIPNMIRLDNIKVGKKENKIPIIGFIGRFEKIKGVDVLVEALKTLKNRSIKFKAIIAGDGVEKDNIIAMIDKYGLNQQISLPGWISDKDSFYNNIDLLCVPSRYEPFGIVILEAFARSIPVIISKQPGPLDIAGDLAEEISFDVNNPSELASKIGNIILNKKYALELQNKCYSKIDKYEFNYVASKIDECLRMITSRETSNL